MVCKIKNLFKKIFCEHKNNEVIYWHWVHQINNNDDMVLEIQMRCKYCGKCHFRYINSWNECRKFISEHKDKQMI